MNKKRIFFSFLIVTMAFTAFGQNMPPVAKRGSTVIDDSTKNVYGPSTTLYNYEKNIIYNLDSLKPSDTTLIDFHYNFHPLDQLKYTYHDLGNLGTALNPLFTSSPNTIGARLGVEAFDYYLFDPAKIEYYDTKSPYSWFRATWGGGGRSKTEVGYTRNINPRWNFGGNYKSYLADKQVQKQRRGDRNVESIGYNFFTSYRSKNEKYWLFSSFDRTKHQQFEQGGLSVSDSSNIDLFFSAYVGTFMSTAKSTFFKNNVHLYHDYRLSEFFRFFHTLDREKRTASFTADQTSDDINFFDNIEIVSLEKEEEDFNKFTELNNRLGVNGTAKNFYYSAYIQRRDIKMEYQWMNTDSLGIKTKNAEHYAGFESGWKVKDLFRAQIEGKVMLNGGSQFKGEISSKWLEGKASRTVYLPSFYQYAYRGHYDYWNFNYDLSTHTHYDVTGILGVKGITLKPHFEYNLFDNYIAFKKINNIKGAQNVFPIQGNGYIMTAIPGVSLELKYKKLTYEGTIKNIQQFGESSFLMPIPEWYLWSRLTLHSFFFKENLEIQAGVQVHWKSDFYAMAYDPAIQQFYVQNEFLVKNYWLTGVFMNAKVKRGLIFIRFNNLRQLLNPTGYISTPYYRGEGPLFDFGFKLPFYD